MTKPNLMYLSAMFPAQPVSETLLDLAASAERRGDTEEANSLLATASQMEKEPKC